MAPEIYQLSHVTLSMNIFTLAMVFAFFLSGGIHPFALEKEERIANIKKKQPIILTANQLLNVTGAAEIFDLISLMLSFDATQRPTASEVLAFLNQQQLVLAVGCHHSPLPTESSLSDQIPSREGSSLLGLPPSTSADADQVEGVQNNAYSTPQLQDYSIDASRSRSIQSCSSSPTSSSGLQQDQELNARY